VGPRGYELVSCESDLRVGGAYRFVQRAPDGTIHAFKGVYREIAALERIVFTQIYEPWPDQEVVVSTTLSEQDGRTAMSQRLSSVPRRPRDGMIGSGMEQGEAQSFERLDELLAELLRSEAGGAAADPEFAFEHDFERSAISSGKHDGARPPGEVVGPGRIRDVRARPDLRPAAFSTTASRLKEVFDQLQSLVGESIFV